MQELFFDLIRVAIGEKDCLSRPPSKAEWMGLYSLAEKHALLGVCFAAVSKLEIHGEISESALYMKWTAMAAMIQQRNELLNKRCRQLLAKLSDEGLRGCILKGQGVVRYYKLRDESLERGANSLGMLRQSGDIDVWIDGGLEAVMTLAKKNEYKPKVAEHHIDLPIFKDVDVEAHFTPSYMRCPWRNTRLQRWFKEVADRQFSNIDCSGICTPTTEFNCIFLLLHAFRHLTGEGIGLRQMMDYYFVLKARNNNCSIDLNLCRKLGMMKFMSAMMWVMQKVFGLEQAYMLCPPDEKEGRFLLNEIMHGGNFGLYDNRGYMPSKFSKMTRYIKQTQRNIHLVAHYPCESISSPFWRVWIWIWRKWHGWV